MILFFPLYYLVTLTLKYVLCTLYNHLFPNIYIRSSSHNIEADDSEETNGDRQLSDNEEHTHANTGN